MPTARSDDADAGRVWEPTLVASPAALLDLRSPARTVKHALDRTLAALALLATAPLLAIVALALRRRGGPVLRRDMRLGENGRHITLVSFAVTGDRCVARIWHRLAATGVAALPQLWNVVRGDLSLVGPRPRDVDLPPLSIRPGLTGLAQLEQLGRALTLSEQLALDDRYARSWSLALDVRILGATLLRLAR
jgi:lipopolysaccharide/colanic/teichoic acid biosynthesis glycosyltransferase